jgi:hypothetical protein
MIDRRQIMKLALRDALEIVRDEAKTDDPNIIIPAASNLAIAMFSFEIDQIHRSKDSEELKKLLEE